MRDVEEIARLAVDCGLRIHKELGPGLLEAVYEAVLASSLARLGLVSIGSGRSTLNSTAQSFARESSASSTTTMASRLRAFA